MSAAPQTQPVAEILTASPQVSGKPADLKPAVVKSGGGRKVVVTVMLVIFGVVMVLASAGASYYFFIGDGQSYISNYLPK